MGNYPRPPAFDEGMLGFFHTLQHLKLNKRTGWVNKGAHRPESVADHMFRMAMMAQATSDSTLNLNRCIMMALVHDLAEADVGDITPPAVSGVSQEDKLALEANAMERITALLSPFARMRIMSLWQEYEDRQTSESCFVKDLDRFELAVQGVEYERSQGIEGLQSFFETTVPKIQHPEVIAWTQELMAERRELWEQRGWLNYVHLGPPEHEASPVPSTSSHTAPYERPLGFEQGMLGYFHTLENLKTNKRTGWVNKNVPLPESIADHMYRMAVISLVVDDDALDLPRCVNMALIHDLAESDVGDITPFLVSGVTAEAKHALEQTAMARISSLLPGPTSPTSISPREKLLSYWSEYEDRQTGDSCFVKDLDMFELALQAVEYERSSGTTGLQSFFDTTIPKILHPQVKEWARELMDERRELWVARGWSNEYIHVEVASSSNGVATNGSAEGVVVNGAEEYQSKCSIPLRVFGEHPLSVATLSNGN